MPSATAGPETGSLRTLLGNRGRRVRVIVALACGVIGSVAVSAAAIGASGTRDVTDQLSYIASGGMLGLFLVGVAATLLVLDFMIEQQATADQLASDLTEMRVRLLGPELSLVDPPRAGWRGPEAATGPASSEQLVAVAGARRVHRSDCSLVAGKQAAEPITADAASDAGLEPCRVCEPDVASRRAAGSR